jgi:flagellar basal body-associated protein FliL
MEPETTQQPNTGDSDKGSMGPLIGSIIIIIILVIGAIYVWGSKIDREEAPVETTENELAPLSTDNSAESLEADLLNTPDIDVDIDNI